MAKGSTGKKLVIVESPTKARTIKKFLGKEYVVESCMGHVRDLPQSAKDIPEKFKKLKWSHLGVNVDDEFQPLYCIPKNKIKVVKSLKEKIADADELYLATDEDREGESISWHLLEILKPQIPFKRMVFHEITKEAILQALKDVREVDANLVHAQEARRVLDRLVGYTISPLLWKKVAYGLSAGRVQSVAVRLIAEREHERLRFKRTEYWGLTGAHTQDNIQFESRLVAYQGKKIAIGKDFGAETGELLENRKSEVMHLYETDAQKIAATVKGQNFIVDEVEEKPISRKPAPPFITSTLQQEANRKLGLSSRETMQIAQKLYERGIITYMRTDSTNLSQQAISAARESIEKLYGQPFLPPEPRSYSGKKVKGAQEAHEAIRPAGTSFLHPDETGLSGGMLKLYDLIWKRTMASQMVNAEQKQVAVRLRAGEAQFTTNGLTLVFPGYLKAYVEGRDDPEQALDEREVPLPPLKKGQSLPCQSLTPAHHETKPPARYTEASLVQTMEREGIGRPSTYASIIGTIQDRGYVRKVGTALVPTFTALVVSKLLKNHLPNFVDLGFTSQMEKSLDDIAQGELDWVQYLRSIYLGKTGLKNLVETREKAIDPADARGIELDGLKNLSFRIGRYGAYVCRKDGADEVCASLPDTQTPGDMTAEAANKFIDQKIKGADALGRDPVKNLPVYVLTGRYGPYVQLGEAEEEGGEKPKRMAIPPTMDPSLVTLKDALLLLELPKTLGVDPATQKEIKKGLGRFGPYVVMDGDFRSIPKGEDIFAVDLNRALQLLAEPKKGRGRSAPVKELGPLPGSTDVIAIFVGKYGPYMKVGKKNYSLPEGATPEGWTLEQAAKLIGDKDDGEDTVDDPPPKKTPKKTAKVAKPVKTAATTKVSSPLTPANPAAKAKPKKASASVRTKTKARTSTVNKVS
jgi:DNA topoisomerase-1